MTCDRFHLVGIVGTVLAVLLCPRIVAQTSDPHKLLAEADRLAWLRVWTRAEPLYAKAREAFIASGDERNALYAEVSRLLAEAHARVSATLCERRALLDALAALLLEKETVDRNALDALLASDAGPSVCKGAAAPAGSEPAAAPSAPLVHQASSGPGP